MTSALPFALDPGDVLEPEPRVVLDDGVAFGVVDRATVPPPVLTVAWLQEPLGVTLEEVVAEELPRLLTQPEVVLIDQEPVTVAGRDALRTFTVHRGSDGLPAGERGLVGLAPQEVPVALAAAVDLGPRPVPDGPPMRLASGAMAVLIGRHQAHGHGLPAGQATALQRRLDAGVRHWSVRLHARAGALRRNLEVLDGDRGIWRVRPATDGTIELAPTTSTTVLRELVALCAAPYANRSREPRRG